jgi:branched-chain amino acid transport system substrate-binding protein
LALAAATAPASAEIKIGITISTTGPAAALGIPEKNMIELWPKELNGEKVTIILLDDAGDPSQATTNARRFVNDDKVDIIMGSSTTPPSNAVSGVAFEANVPHFALGPVSLQPGRGKMTFVLPQETKLMAGGIFKYMKAKGLNNVGMIGFSDSWGDQWLGEFKAQAEPLGMKLTNDERYARADTSVTGQALKLVATKPDAVFVAASGTGAALPQIALRERGYTGPIYHSAGSVSQDLIRVAGKAVEDAVIVSGPAAVADQLPEGHPTKAAGMAYIAAYEGKYGVGTRNQFGGHANDAWLIFSRVAGVAMKTAKPGTPEFRAALVKALESEKDIVASHGVYNFTPTDHGGLDDRGWVVITVKDGKFVMAK